MLHINFVHFHRKEAEEAATGNLSSAKNMPFVLEQKISEENRCAVKTAQISRDMPGVRGLSKPLSL
jgi:hypothetical protein